MRQPTDITPLTFLDYPHKAACILWYSGCNLRCPYCYNPDLALDKNPAIRDVIPFLRERRDFLDAVVISGGECTLNPDIRELCTRIKALGYLVKIDTNGSNPAVLHDLLDAGLIDYVAMDHKMPAARSWKIRGGVLFDRFSECMRLLTGSGINFEVRTTVHPMLLDEADILQMIRESVGLGYDQTYYLQYFFDAGKTLGNLPPPSRRYDRGLLDERSPLRIGYRNFPEDRFKY